MAATVARIGLLSALLYAAAATAQPPPMVGLAGQETFPGLPLADLTVGVNFAGWTVVDGGTWYPIEQNSGASWFAAVSYRGRTRGPGDEVELIHGYWAVTSADEAFGGSITGGRVRWPDGSEPEWGCFAEGGAYPVAAFTATLDLGESGPAGTLTGCIDDIRWDPQRPLTAIPRIWGEIRFQPLPDG